MVVRSIAYAWLLTLPACAVSGAIMRVDLEAREMTRNHWFLPQSADVLGMLSAQAAVTVEGMEALLAWAGGEAAAGERVRELEHAADRSKRELREALTEAFSTPLEPEDIFELSTGLDELLNSAKNIVGESEAMQSTPDGATAEMATRAPRGRQAARRGLHDVRARESARSATAEADPCRQGPARPPAQLP